MGVTRSSSTCSPLLEITSARPARPRLTSTAPSLITVSTRSTPSSLSSKLRTSSVYLIDAENLELFKKPVHFVNYIKHLEAYKTEFNKMPHEDTKHNWSFAEAFPGLPKIGH